MVLIAIACIGAVCFICGYALAYWGDRALMAKWAREAKITRCVYNAQWTVIMELEKQIDLLSKKLHLSRCWGDRR